MQFRLRSLIVATFIGPPLLASLAWYAVEVSRGSRSVAVELMNYAIPTVVCLTVVYLATQLPDKSGKPG